MLIQEIDENKKRYLHVLLLADEQEDLVLLICVKR